VKGLNVRAGVQAGVNLLHFIPLRASYLNVSGVSLDASVKLVEREHSWSLYPSIEVQMQDMEIQIE